MFSMLGDIVNSILNFFVTMTNLITLDLLFIIALGLEVVLVIFFLIKSSFSYEAALNRSLDKLNYWLFEKKVVTEDNIKDLNMLFKTKAPKRLCYYWQQYILFREGNPSTYLSTENLVEKPLKTSSYNSNIKNLSLFTFIWSVIVGMFVLVSTNSEAALMGGNLAMALMVPIFVGLIGVIFVVYLRARKNSILNSLYQNVALFGRFMDNACIDLPSYIDYQILFTPQEIEKGQPVLREFLDYKARKEKEEFNKAKEESINYETYDFSSTGVDGSLVLDRAMKESELFLKKKDKILVKVSQLEAELDSRKKNFDNVQKDYQTKIQASKENVNRLRQMQEETTNRIESNYYRKQQTQEIGKQEQYEQEFEQLRAKYLLEKNECEEEIAQLNQELETYKRDVETAMIGEYQTFFDKFCHSAEKVVAKVFDDKINNLKSENDKDKQYITELEIKLKSVPQGVYDAKAEESEKTQVSKNTDAKTETSDIPAEGRYDENGNYIYPNGTYYDKDGNFHDENGNVYSQDGKLISEAPVGEPKSEEPKKAEKQIVDLDSFDEFDFMTDTAQKGDIYGVAENIINSVDKDNDIEVINNTEKNQPLKEFKEEQGKKEEQKKKIVDYDKAFEDFSLADEKETKVDKAEKVEDKEAEEPAEQVAVAPKKKAGRPRKVVVEEEKKPAGKRGRPRKVVVEEAKTPAKRPGRPKKIVTAPAEPAPAPKKKAGRPKKIVKEAVAEPEVKRGRGRPKKQISSILEINKKLSEEEAKLHDMRRNLNRELELAMNELDTNKVDDKQTRREELLKEIDNLQVEAQNAIKKNESEEKISEINAKLENILEEIKNLNS